MSSVGMAHVLCGVLALILGAVVVFQRKGTQRHRKIGYAYLFSMLMLNGLAFCMYRFNGHFGPFHVLSIISLITLLNGWMVAFFRKPADRWLQIHLYWMNWSYIGLWAAFFTEIVVRLPFIRTQATMITAVIITTVCVTLLGNALLFRYMRRSGLTFNALPAKHREAL